MSQPGEAAEGEALLDQRFARDGPGAVVAQEGGIRRRVGERYRERRHDHVQETGIDLIILGNIAVDIGSGAVTAIGLGQNGRTSDRGT